MVLKKVAYGKSDSSNKSGGVKPTDSTRIEITEILQQSNRMRYINDLIFNTLWFIETEELFVLRRELIKVIREWWKCNDLFKKYFEWVSVIVTDTEKWTYKEGLEFERWEIAFTLMKAIIFYNGGNIEKYIEDANDALMTSLSLLKIEKTQKIKDNLPLSDSLSEIGFFYDDEGWGG